MRRKMPCLVRTPTDAQMEPIIRLWVLRIIVQLGAHPEFVSRHGLGNDDLAELLGLGHWIELDEREFDPRQIRSELRTMLVELEGSTSSISAPNSLTTNLQHLAELIGLSDTDCRILEFAVLINTENLLDDVADWLGNLTSMKTCAILAVVLNLPEMDVRQALASRGSLARSGLLTLDKAGTCSLTKKLQLLSRCFADTLMSVGDDPLKLIRDTVYLSSDPHLDLDDYPYLEKELAILKPYLEQALASGRGGVNIFIHGDPGTGKSQLVKALAKAYQCQLFEVACEDDDGDAITGSKRLRAFRVAQSFLARRRAMILFDEVEDVFDDGEGIWGGKSTAQKNKAWINRILEGNPVPTFWLSNSAEGLDPAFIRRFDMIFQVRVPPRSHRRNILRKQCGGLLSEHLINRIAASESLAPAVVTRAASVVNTIRSQLGEERAGCAFELIVNNTLETQGHKPIAGGSTQPLPDLYDPAFLNVDQDLTPLTNGLKTAGAARLCLYGPPGTGKTAWGRWLADELDKPLVVKRGSDLLSMWLGGTEKNIAAAFREAESEGAVLLIDEVDSFLQDRRGAQRNWEITGVNEMLTGMESFNGIFVATTNLMSGLDQAALRRFDQKLCFGYLFPKQAESMLQHYCRMLAIPDPERHHLASVRQLTNLTPGDFAVILRQSRFRPFVNPEELVACLRSDCALKEDKNRAIGFVH